MNGPGRGRPRWDRRAAERTWEELLTGRPVAGLHCDDPNRDYPDRAATAADAATRPIRRVDTRALLITPPRPGTGAWPVAAPGTDGWDIISHLDHPHHPDRSDGPGWLRWDDDAAPGEQLTDDILTAIALYSIAVAATALALLIAGNAWSI